MKSVLNCMGIFFGSFLAANLNAQEINKRDIHVLGTAQSDYLSRVLLNTDLVEMNSKALGFEMMGNALDSVALKLKKFEKVPRYRVTRVLQGLAALNRTNLTDRDDEVVMKAIQKMKDNCDSSEPCQFTLLMKQEHWIKPLPDFSKPASESDRKFYDASFAKSYFYLDITDTVDNLKRTGKTKILGVPFQRDPKLGPMTAQDVKDFEKQVTEAYVSLLQKRYFVETTLGWYRTQEVRSDFLNFPWNDLTSRSKNFPTTYQEVVDVIEEGLNHFYLSQKREEIYWGLLSSFDNDLMKLANFLLDEVNFIPALTFYSLDNPMNEQTKSLLNYKKDTLETIETAIKERGKMIATQILKQTILVVIDDKERLN